ncbi:MAG: lipopolysaccharide biosynthesis protein [Gordonia polyisoprenivorans]|nr:lipopolysaccharide biosynthesis protein [Gordonia polyisoprenivorans]
MSTELGTKATRGVVVTLASRWGNTATMLVSSVLLARLLSPTDFGIVAMVTAISGFAILFQDLGLTSAAVRARELSRGEQTSLFGLNVVLGLFLGAAMFLVAPLLAAFYDRPEVADVARALSVTFLITSLGGQARADLLRDLRFGVLAATQVVAGVLQLGVSLGCALAGFGYWSLVIASIAVSIWWAGSLLSASRFRPTRPAPFTQVSGLVVQGGQITLIQATTFLSRNLDVIAIGRFHGAEDTGLYNRASQVVSLVEQQLIAAVNAVTLPVLARLQDDEDGFRWALRRGVSAMGHVLSPLFTILSLVAVPAVQLVYGSQWSAAGHLLVVLALAGSVRGLFVVVEQAATALNQMKRQIAAALSTQVATGAAVFIASIHSVYAVAVTYVISVFVSVLVGVWWISRGSFIRMSDVMGSFGPTLVVWGVAYVIARVASGAADLENEWVTAGVAVAVEVVVASALIVSIRSLRREVIQLARMLMGAFRRKTPEQQQGRHRA